VSDTLKGVATLAYKTGLRVSEIANLNGVKLILNKEFLGLKLQKPKITSPEPSILILK
jgi:site-specific recombinase XerD